MLCVIQARYDDDEEWSTVGAAETPEKAHQQVGVAVYVYLENERPMPEFRIVGVEITDVLWPTRTSSA